MPKPKSKKAVSQTDVVDEEDVFKALTEVEELLEKGELPEDPEGDLSDEGESLSAKGRGKKMVKAKPPVDDESADDDSGDDDSMPDDESDDDESDDEGSAAKSFRTQVEDNETISKAIEVSDFIEAIVDEVGTHLDTTRKALVNEFRKALGEAMGSFAAHVDARVAKSIGGVTEFQRRLGRATAAIGTTLNDVEEMVKSFGERPAGAPRGKAVLSKSEVVHPPGHREDLAPAGGNEAADIAALADVDPDKIFNWMFEKSCSDELDSRLIIQFEADKKLENLPWQVRKALAKDLCK